MDTMTDSSNLDVHGTSSKQRPTSLDPSAFTRGTAQLPSAHQSISNHVGIHNLNGNVPSDVQPQVTQEQFAGIVIKADNRIPRSKLKDIIYLCHDKVRDRHVLEQAKSAKDIFEDMKVFGKLTTKNIILISELLHRMGMLRDKSHVFKGTKVEWKPGMSSTLDEFRCLLYSIAEQIPSKELKKMKAFVSDQQLVEPYSLEDCQDFLDFFTLLEDEAVIEADNIGVVKDFTNILQIQKVKDYVEKYEEQMTIQKRPVLAITQEDSKRLMTFSTLKSTEDLSTLLSDIIGAEAYQELIQQWNQERKKAKLPGTGEAPSHEKRYSPPKMASDLVTPNMLTKDCRAKKKDKKNFGTDSDLDSATSMDESAPSSLNAQDEVRPNQNRDVQSLKSTDMEIDSSSEEDMKILSLETENDPYTTSHQTLHRHMYPFYPMNKNPKGICLIISNKIFEDEKVQDREGTEKDVENLRKTFGEKLNFEIHVRENLTAAKMIKELQKWRDHNHSKYNAFICCLLSHGNRGVVMGTDGKVLKLSLAMGYFKGNCPSLVDKPKIFIVQACQGDNWQGFADQTVPRSPTGESVGIGSIIAPQVPNEADFVLLLATVPGFKSARNKSRGSWFIMALTKILQNVPDIEIHSAMTILNDKLSKVNPTEMDGKRIVQTAFPSNTLRRMLFFQQPVDSEGGT